MHFITTTSVAELATTAFISLRRISEDCGEEKVQYAPEPNEKVFEAAPDTHLVIRKNH